VDSEQDVRRRGSYRTQALEILIELLTERRKKKRISLRALAAKLPPAMGFTHSTLGKVERRVQDLSYAEARDVAKALDTSLSELDAQVEHRLSVLKGTAPAKLAKKKTK